MKNKLISILLCLAMVVSLFTVTALAADDETLTEDQTEESVIEETAEEPAEDVPVEDIISEEPEMVIAPAEYPEEVVLPAFITLCKAGEYSVNSFLTQNGEVTAATDEEGNVVLTVVPAKGYALETISVKNLEGNEIELVNNEDGTFTFAMPAEDVYAAITFMEDNTMLNFCMDVTYRDWYYDDVLYVYENGIMSGTSNVAFSPKMPTSRGMIATILYRLEGEPAFMNDNIFSDVKEGAYYEKAVVWANGKGIVKGYEDGTYKPGANITREQLAAILYRYAQYKGEGFVGTWMFLLDFDDANQISGYANEAMHWCVMKGIINGVGNKLLNPKATATRAEVAAMLHSFIEVMGDAMDNEPYVEPVVEETTAEETEYTEYDYSQYEGTFEDENFNTITFIPTNVVLADGSSRPYDVEIGIYRLTTFTGKADFMDGALEIVVEDPNGGILTATFYPTDVEGVYELIVTTSTWSLLEAGTIFTGFRLKVAE